MTDGPRIDYSAAPGALQALLGLEACVRRTALEESLTTLVKLRASYLNGCAYCVDMHTRDALAAGESERRLFAVPVWRDTPFFTGRERAALAWTDTVTQLADGVSDADYAAARRVFGEEEMVGLTMAVIAINSWNRLSIAFRAPVGSYEPPARRA